jgi:hypothetical protein
VNAPGAPDRGGKRPLVGLGDLIRAAATLDATPETCARIEALLGLPLARRAPARRPPPLPAAPGPTPPPAVTDPTDPQRREREEQLGQGFRSAAAGGFDLVEVKDEARPAATRAALVPLPRPASGPGLGLPPIEPLLPPRSARNILSALMAVEVEEGPIDTLRLADELAACRPVERLPRARAATLRLGAVVLVDRGDGMEPFRRDVEPLIASIEHVLGLSRVTLLSFDGDPAKVSRWNDGAPCPLAPPAGTKLLLVSDLGLRRPSEEATWLAFVRRVGRADCSLVALSPYPAARWPKRLRRRVQGVSWDRATTVAAARRAGRGARGPR